MKLPITWAKSPGGLTLQEPQCKKACVVPRFQPGLPMTFV